MSLYMFYKERGYLDELIHPTQNFKIQAFHFRFVPYNGSQYMRMFYKH